MAREQRLFKNPLKFFGANTPVRSIRLHKIREYQKERRKQISPTMKKNIEPRTINYELQLLRWVMTYADCWTSDLEARYQPLRQVKSQMGKAATKEQLIKIFNTAIANDYWYVAMCCAAVAAGSRCRGGEIRKLRLADVFLDEGRLRIVGEIAKNRKEREPRLMALAEWGLRQLLLRAQALGATGPGHFLLPLQLSKSNRVTIQWPIFQRRRFLQTHSTAPSTRLAIPSLGSRPGIPFRWASRRHSEVRGNTPTCPRTQACCRDELPSHGRPWTLSMKKTNEL